MSVLLPDSFQPTGTLEIESDVVIARSEPTGDFALVGLPIHRHDGFMAALRSNGYSARKQGSRGNVSEWLLRRTAPKGTTGRIVAERSIHVDNNVRGNCSLEATGGVEIGDGVQWEGHVQAGADILLGPGTTVTGNVATPATLTLQQGARIMGDVLAGRVEIADGAAVVGRVHTNRAEATREH